MHAITPSRATTLLEDLKNDPKFAAAYLGAAAETEEDQEVFLAALRDVAIAYGMAEE